MIKRGSFLKLAGSTAAVYFPRFFLAKAAAPFLPKCVRTCGGRCATVRLFRAAVAAFLIFLRAAARCFGVATANPVRMLAAVLFRRPFFFRRFLFGGAHR